MKSFEEKEFNVIYNALKLCPNCSHSDECVAYETYKEFIEDYYITMTALHSKKKK